jgi:hypothetical protein
MTVDDDHVRGQDLVLEKDTPRHIIHSDIETRTIQEIMNEGVVVSVIGALENGIRTDLDLETILATENTTDTLGTIKRITTRTMIGTMISATMNVNTKQQNLQKF